MQQQTKLENLNGPLEDNTGNVNDTGFSNGRGIK